MSTVDRTGRPDPTESSLAFSRSTGRSTVYRANPPVDSPVDRSLLRSTRRSTEVFLGLIHAPFLAPFIWRSLCHLALSPLFLPVPPPVDQAVDLGLLKPATRAISRSLCLPISVLSSSTSSLPTFPVLMRSILVKWNIKISPYSFETLTEAGVKKGSHVTPFPT